MRRTVGARSGSLPLSPQIFLPLVKHITGISLVCVNASARRLTPSSSNGDQQTSSARSRVPISPIVRFFHLCG